MSEEQEIERYTQKEIEEIDKLFLGRFRSNERLTIIHILEHAGFRQPPVVEGKLVPPQREELINDLQRLVGGQREYAERAADFMIRFGLPATPSENIVQIDWKHCDDCLGTGYLGNKKVTAKCLKCNGHGKVEFKNYPATPSVEEIKDIIKGHLGIIIDDNTDEKLFSDGGEFQAGIIAKAISNRLKEGKQ